MKYIPKYQPDIANMDLRVMLLLTLLEILQLDSPLFKSYLEGRS